MWNFLITFSKDVWMQPDMEKCPQFVFERRFYCNYLTVRIIPPPQGARRMLFCL